MVSTTAAAGGCPEMRLETLLTVFGQTLVTSRKTSASDAGVPETSTAPAYVNHVTGSETALALDRGEVFACSVQSVYSVDRAKLTEIRRSNMISG
jgi:hypothetical protein